MAVWLGTLRALGAYPPLAKIDFSWVPNSIAELPNDFEVLAKERKERRWVSYDALARVPDQIRQDVERVYGRDERATALMARDALLIEWMITLPWRQRNIRECKLLSFAKRGNLSKEEIPTNSTMAKAEWAQQQLRANPAETFWQFYFRPEETKTGNIVRAILPYQLVGPLEDYLRCYRPILVDGVDPHTLFLNDHGRPFCSRRLESLVGDLTLRYAGRRVNPHLFRDILALKWLEDHPEDFLTLSKILWHRNIKTTLQIYGANFDESHGARRVEQWLDARRKATDKP